MNGVELIADIGLLEFIQQNLTLLSAGISAMFVAVTGGIGWIVRVIWLKYDERCKAHDARQDIKAVKEGKTLDTLTETMPILAENGKRQTAILEECRRFDSDFIRLHGDLNEKVEEGFHEIAAAVIASACPEQKPVVEAHVDRFIKRKEEGKRKPDAPPGFGQMPVVDH